METAILGIIISYQPNNSEPASYQPKRNPKLLQRSPEALVKDHAMHRGAVSFYSRGVAAVSKPLGLRAGRWDSRGRWEPPAQETAEPPKLPLKHLLGPVLRPIGAFSGLRGLV